MAIWFNGNLPTSQAQAAILRTNPQACAQSIAVRNTGASTQVLTWMDWQGATTNKTLGSGETWLLRDQFIQFMWCDGGTVYAFAQDEPSWADPKYFAASAAGAQDVNLLSQSAGLALDATLTGGTLLETNSAAILTTVNAIKAQTDKLTFHSTALFTTTT